MIEKPRNIEDVTSEVNVLKIEVIDHTHPEINISTRPERFSSIAFPSVNNVYLTNAAVDELCVRAGQYIHFAILDGHLYFYVDDDSTGFKLATTGTQVNQKALRANSVRIIQYLLAKFPDSIKVGARFKFKVTTSFKDKSPLIEVLLDKPIQHKDKFVAPKPPSPEKVFSQPRSSQL